MSGAYDAEIAATDTYVSRLIGSLEASGRLDDTVIVVVADHGESLGEHDEQTHGFFVYDATVHIPLVIAGPGVVKQVIDSQVRIVDVMPTALELLDVDVPAAVQGASLIPLTEGAKLDLLAFSETWYPRYRYGWAELLAVRDGRYKFVAAPRRELYDVRDDPGETRDLSSVNPRLADSLERALHELMAGGGRERSAAHAGERRPRSRGEAPGVRVCRLEHHGAQSGGSTARRSQRQDWSLRIPEDGGDGFGRRASRRRHCQSAAGARGRSRRSSKAT